MSEGCSTAHNVRRFDGGSARGYVEGGSTEQDSYEPRPAGWEGAERLTARRLGVFSFDSSAAVSFLGHQKYARRCAPEETDAKRRPLAGG